METDRKDKLIIALIIGIVIVLSHNFVSSKKSDELVFENISSSLNDQKQAKPISNNDNKEKSEKSTLKKVHISGEINKPGVYEINDNYRLEDLVNDAGGLTENADLNKINLALKLEDQMRIIIPNINDKDNNENNTTTQLISPINVNDNKKVDINTADKSELMTLPNIGEKRADAIIEYRQKNKFNKIEDIKNVSGIGDKYFEAMKDMIVVNWGVNMKLSTRGRYGLRAIHYLAENEDNGYISVSDISNALNLPENYLEQLIRILKRNNLVISARGAKGGYKLSRKSSEITVGDVLRVLEGEMTSSECVADRNNCNNEDCEAYYVFAKIDDAINKAVNSITIKDMVNEKL